MSITRHKDLEELKKYEQDHKRKIRRLGEATAKLTVGLRWGRGYTSLNYI